MTALSRTELLPIRTVLDLPAHRLQRVAQAVCLCPVPLSAGLLALGDKLCYICGNIEAACPPCGEVQAEYRIETIDCCPTCFDRQIALDQFPQHRQRARQIQILVDLGVEASDE